MSAKTDPKGFGFKLWRLFHYLTPQCFYSYHTSCDGHDDVRHCSCPCHRPLGETQ